MEGFEGGGSFRGGVNHRDLKPFGANSSGTSLVFRLCLSRGFEFLMAATILDLVFSFLIACLLIFSRQRKAKVKYEF